MILTITIPPEDEKRVTRAFGAGEIPATQEQLEATCRGWLAQGTIDWERGQAQAKIEIPPLGLMA